MSDNNSLIQENTDTKFDRYPKLFNDVKNFYADNKIIPKILSFGCSEGHEPLTLKLIYFKHSVITGLDLNKETIINNKNNKILNEIKFYDNSTDLIKNDTIYGKNKYDLIFALSVLCKWPENKNNKIFTFDEFTKALYFLDSILNVGGCLCMYNTKFFFEDTVLFNKYQAILTTSTDTGFIKKYDKNNVFVPVDRHYSRSFLFKKLT